mmetsp:Transcript_11935/g.15392  ORF Transcript_11935/g.15392 Transcript_11935/m.15392 type:complete len:454 (+) Transcript_11935:114-1475(+)
MSNIDDYVNQVIENERSLLKFRWRNLQNHGCARMAELLLQHRFRRITEIDICGNDIGNEGIAALAKALSSDRKCRTLSLNCNSYHEEGMESIAQLLRVNETITALDISGSRSGDEGLKYIADALCDRHYLEELKVSRSSLGAGIGEEGAMALKRMIECNESLISLSLWGSRLGNDGVISLARGLTENKYLTSLDLGWSGIGDEGLKVIGECLVSNRIMQILDLRNNDISTAGVVQFTDILKAWEANETSFFVANCTLNTVMLSGNPVFEIAEKKKANIKAEKKALLKAQQAKAEEREARNKLDNGDAESVTSISTESSLGSLPPLPSRKSVIFSGIKAMNRASRLVSDTHLTAAATRALQELFSVLSAQGREKRVEDAVQRHNDIVEEIARSRRELELALEAERQAKREWWGRRANQLHHEQEERSEDEVMRLWNKADMDRRTWAGSSPWGSS